MSVLTVSALNQSYGGSHTLWDVDLVVPVGSRICLMGRNGMGKTTLLKCIMGLLPATSGEVVFAGTDLLKLPAHGRARLGIGYVPQGREIFSHLTVEENLRIGLGVRKNGARSIPPLPSYPRLAVTQRLAWPDRPNISTPSSATLN